MFVSLVWFMIRGYLPGPEVPPHRLNPRLRPVIFYMDLVEHDGLTSFHEFFVFGFVVFLLSYSVLGRTFSGFTDFDLVGLIVLCSTR